MKEWELMLKMVKVGFALNAGIVFMFSQIITGIVEEIYIGANAQNVKPLQKYITVRKLQCELYQCGYDRLGCLCCPLASKRQREKEMYDFPKYKQAYIHAFDRMIEERKLRGKDTKWSCGEEVYLWWMQDSNIVGQMELSDFIEY